MAWPTPLTSLTCCGGQRSSSTRTGSPPSSALSRDAAVDDVVDLSLNGTPTMDAYLLSEDAADGWGQYVYACNWWVQQFTTVARPLQEKLTLFWHGHFTSAWYEIHKGFQMMPQNQLFRLNALGNLRTLTQSVALDPAMLVYLSNADNVKGQPNQNFARELMELFTLGVGNYTEDDVAIAARAWTGYNYDRTTLRYVYRDDRHDATPGTFFGVTQAWTGPQVVDAIFDRKGSVVAAFIARKLWEFFAYVGPAQGIVDDLAAVLVASGFELKPLLTALFKRPEFYSDQAKQGLVRSPIEYVVALSAASGISGKDLGVAWRLESTGQRMYMPPNVSGWKPNGAWLNGCALSGRAGFADNVAWRLADGTAHDDLATGSLNATNAAAAVDKAAALLGLTSASGRTLSDVTRQALTAWWQTESSSYWRKRNLMMLMLTSPEMNLA
ncbi:MAG: DUF1800 domain-containing protein [Ilumatobacteraceae bacterium]